MAYSSAERRKLGNRTPSKLPCYGVSWEKKEAAAKLAKEQKIWYVNHFADHEDDRIPAELVDLVQPSMTIEELKALGRPVKFQATPRSMEPENYEEHEFSYELRLKLLRGVMVLESVIVYPPKQSHKRAY